MIRVTLVSNSDGSVIASHDCANQAAVDAWVATQVGGLGDSASYSINSEDLSDHALECSHDVLSQVRTILKAKNLDDTATNAMLDDAALTRILKLLVVGGMDKVKAKINALDNTFFTTDEKASLVAIIDAAGLG